MSEVIELEAEPIEEGIEPLQGLRLTLSELAQRANALAAEYAPRYIEGEEDYAQSKRERSGLRKARDLIQLDFKAVVDPIRDMLAEADSQRRAALAEVDAKEAAYASEVKGYEERWKSARRAALAEEYADFAPDLVPLVPFAALMDRYGRDKGAQWDARSMTEAKAADLMRKAVEQVAEAERTIEAMVAPEDREAVKAGFFASLDLQRALTDAAQRAEQRERVRRLEEERRAREEEARRQAEEAERQRQEAEKVAQAAREAAEAALAAQTAQVPTIEHNGPQIGSERPSGLVTHMTPAEYVAECEAMGTPVTESTRQRLLGEMATLAGMPKENETPAYVFAGYGTKAQAEAFVEWCDRAGVRRRTKLPTNGKQYKLSAR